jgi:2-keto-4-pentenoate hydratase
MVIAGSCTRVIFAKHGDTVQGDFGVLGGVGVQFI